MPQDWVMGLAGGLIIGSAAAIYLLISGRVMGASGILGGLVDGSAAGSLSERASFVGGLVLVPALVVASRGGAETHLTSNLGLVIFAGLLVGIGTRLANGCTSGHGVCGISRLSVRGLVATACYLLAGGASVVVFKHVLGIV